MFVSVALKTSAQEKGCFADLKINAIRTPTPQSKFSYFCANPRREVDLQHQTTLASEFGLVGKSKGPSMSSAENTFSPSDEAPIESGKKRRAP